MKHNKMNQMGHQVGQQSSSKQVGSSVAGSALGGLHKDSRGRWHSADGKFAKAPTSK